MPEAPDAEHGNKARGVGARDLDRFVGRHASAGERRSVERIYVIRHSDYVAGVTDCVLSKASVDRVAHVELIRAERLPAVVAVAAVPARVSEPGQRDAHAFLEAVGVSLPQTLDDSDALVPRDEWRRGLDRPLAACGVNVGMAKAAGLDPDQDLLGARFWHRDILNLEGTVEA